MLQVWPRLFKRVALSHLKVNVHNVQREMIFNIFRYKVSVLTMTIRHSKEPKVFYLCEVFDDEEVVLILFGLFVMVTPGFRQIRKWSDLIVNFADSLREFRSGLCNCDGFCYWVADNLFNFFNWLWSVITLRPSWFLWGWCSCSFWKQLMTEVKWLLHGLGFSFFNFESICALTRSVNLSFCIFTCCRFFLVTLFNRVVGLVDLLRHIELTVEKCL